MLIDLISNNAWNIIGFTLNVVWFIYAMINQRWTRHRVLEIKSNIFACEIPTHAWLLERHFRKIRNEEGVMLMKSAQGLLQEKKLRNAKSG